jgi:hypothetical protein
MISMRPQLLISHRLTDYHRAEKLVRYTGAGGAGAVAAIGGFAGGVYCPAGDEKNEIFPTLFHTMREFYFEVHMYS